MAGLMDELSAVMDFAFAAESAEGEAALLKLNDVQISWLAVTDSYRLVHQQQITDFDHASKLAQAIPGLLLNWKRCRFHYWSPANEAAGSA